MTSLKAKLDSIREVLDMPVSSEVIEEVTGKAQKITVLMGLAAECKAEARKRLEQGRLKAIMELKNESLTLNLKVKAVEAMCASEHATYEYADRICSAISYTLDTLRSIISLYKSELENSLK